MIRLKWANGERDVTGCRGCPMAGDETDEMDPLWHAYCQADLAERDVSNNYAEHPDWCPLLTLEVERET